MKKCINCGKVSESSNNIFCSACGGELVVSEIVVCENCGSTVSDDAVFCEKCGAKVNSGYSATDGLEMIYVRDSIETKNESGNRALAIVVTAVISVCILFIAAISVAMIIKKDNDSIENKNFVAEKDSSKLKEKNKDESDFVDDEEFYNTEEKIKSESNQNSPKNDSEENSNQESNKTSYTDYGELYDYAPDNDDWYRLRKSKWDASTQIGAYKTVKKALEDAAIYRSQGYTLYDKDFNEIYVESSKSGSEAKSNQESNKTSYTDYGELYDYAPDNDDWYRLRKSKWDASTQIGAYKTVKKALENAAIYRSQGYTLYDKDFNVVE